MPDDREDSRDEWQTLLPGGFAFMTAPFAEHPADRKRASQAVRMAKLAGVSTVEFVQAAALYLEGAQGWPTDKEEQLNLVRRYIRGKLD